MDLQELKNILVLTANVALAPLHHILSPPSESNVSKGSTGDFKQSLLSFYGERAEKV